MQALEQAPSHQKISRSIVWRGRSGRCYTLQSERLDSFALADSDLYLIAKDDHVRWVGTAGDVITDQASRQRFRAAVSEASAVFRMRRPGDELTRATIAWDLEAGERMSTLTAA